MPLVKTEPTAYEGSYECAICWDTCRGDKDILGCVRCPGVRKMHAKCYEGWLAAGKKEGCTQCKGPIGAYVPEFAEACVIMIKSDEEPATMEPEKAKTAQRNLKAEEEAKKTVAEGKEAIAPKREANEDAAKKKRAEEAKTKAEQVNKNTLEPETKRVKGEAEKAKNKQVEEGAAKQKLAAQEPPAKKKAKMQTTAKTSAAEDDKMGMKNEAEEAAATTKDAALRYGRSELRGSCYCVILQCCLMLRFTPYYTPYY
jgi:hypothetical protein